MLARPQKTQSMREAWGSFLALYGTSIITENHPCDGSRAGSSNLQSMLGMAQKQISKNNKILDWRESTGFKTLVLHANDPSSKVKSANASNKPCGPRTIK